MRFFTTLLFVALLSGPLGSAPPTTDDYRKLIDSALTDWKVPGSAVVVVDRDRILFMEGRGVRESGKPEPVTADTVFPIASCGKAFTSTLAAMLVDDGKWGWDDPVRKHLPDFHLKDPDADRMVSIRDILSHRTGVAGHDLLWYRSKLSQAELVDRLGRLPLTKPFRTELQYQSIMYMAAGQAIAKAGGAPWHEQIKKRILEPLGMKSTTLTNTDAGKSSDVAVGHREDRRGRLLSVDPYPFPEPNPAGSIHSTARDLVSWLKFHLNQGIHDGRAFVSESALSETYRSQTIIRLDAGTQPLTPDTHFLSYGFGWIRQDYRGKLLLVHAGLVDGFRVHVVVLPREGFALAILANREATRMNLALANTLVDRLTDLPAKDWSGYYRELLAKEDLAIMTRDQAIEKARPVGAVPVLPVTGFAGRYEDAAYGETTIKAAGDRLFWEWGSWRFPMEYYGHDTYRLVAEDYRFDRAFVRFTIREGRAVAVEWLGTRFDRRGP